MVALDEDALICDFAETYHVLNWRDLPVSTAATLAAGLRPGARIIDKMSGTEYPLNTLLLASAADKLAFLAWAKTKDAQDGRNHPKSILQSLLGIQSQGATQSFDSIEDFDAWRNSMLNQGE